MADSLSTWLELELEAVYRFDSSLAFGSLVWDSRSHSPCLFLCLCRSPCNLFRNKTKLFSKKKPTAKNALFPTSQFRPAMLTGTHAARSGRQMQQMILTRITNPENLEAVWPSSSGQGAGLEITEVPGLTGWCASCRQFKFLTLLCLI